MNKRDLLLDCLSWGTVSIVTIVLAYIALSGVATLLIGGAIAGILVTVMMNVGIGLMREDSDEEDLVDQFNEEDGIIVSFASVAWLLSIVVVGILGILGNPVASGYVLGIFGLVVLTVFTRGVYKRLGHSRYN